MRQHGGLGQHPVRVRQDDRVEQDHGAGAGVQRDMNFGVPAIPRVKPLPVDPGGEADVAEGLIDEAQYLPGVPQPVIPGKLARLGAMAEEDRRSRGLPRSEWHPDPHFNTPTHTTLRKLRGTDADSP